MRKNVQKKLTKNRSRLVALSITAALGLSCLGLYTSQPAKADSTNGKILYVGSRDLDGNDDEIYVMDADGANQTKITDNTDYEYEPAWSADATKVVFTSDRDGDEEIFVMDLDGTNEVKLTNNSSDDSFAAWAPDDSKILFTSNRDGNQEIYSMNTNGSNQTRLTNNSADDYLPSWSPDSDRVAFVSERDSGGDSDIFTMDPDGTNLQQLTSNSDPDTEPDWSPDGTKIAFTGGVIPNSNIFVMNADGSGQTAITNVTFPIRNDYPSWSVDGAKIAFASDRDTNGDEIYSINANGTGEVQLTNIAPDFNYNTNPDWGGTDTTGGGGGPSGDTDSDGVDDAVEAAGPNGGDANNDGTADSIQANVTSFTNSITGNPVTLQSSCTSNSNVSLGAESTSSSDIAFNYPIGLLSFTSTCASPGTTATITLFFYDAVSSPTLRKFNNISNSYQTIEGAMVTATTIGGRNVLRVIYQITDGSVLDLDSSTNGTIIDPVGLGQAIIGAPQTGLGGGRL